jgi:hypothetical protein
VCLRICCERSFCMPANVDSWALNLILVLILAYDVTHPFINFLESPPINIKISAHQSRSAAHQSRSPPINIKISDLPTGHLKSSALFNDHDAKKRVSYICVFVGSWRATR